MKKSFILFLVAVLAAGCSVNPEPLVVGKDVCHTCKMTVMETRFGGEMVTRKGKIYKFDDINCFMAFVKSNYEPDENIAHLLVIDYSQPGRLIEAASAIFYKSPNIKSPMASGVVAFERKEDVEKFKVDWNGAELTWTELLTDSQ